VLCAAQAPIFEMGGVGLAAGPRDALLFSRSGLDAMAVRPATPRAGTTTDDTPISPGRRRRRKRPASMSRSYAVSFDATRGLSATIVGQTLALRPSSRSAPLRHTSVTLALDAWRVRPATDDDTIVLVSVGGDATHTLQAARRGDSLVALKQALVMECGSASSVARATYTIELIADTNLSPPDHASESSALDLQSRNVNDTNDLVMFTICPTLSSAHFLTTTQLA
jgi:hypothetical protein